MALTAVPLLFALCRASVAPRIDQPLTNDIRPAATIATGMVMSTTPVAAAVSCRRHRQLTAGHLVDDSFDAYHTVLQ